MNFQKKYRIDDYLNSMDTQCLPTLDTLSVWISVSFNEFIFLHFLQMCQAYSEGSVNAIIIIVNIVIKNNQILYK